MPSPRHDGGGSPALQCLYHMCSGSLRSGGNDGQNAVRMYQEGNQAERNDHLPCSILEVMINITSAIERRVKFELQRSRLANNPRDVTKYVRLYGSSRTKYGA